MLSVLLRVRLLGFYNPRMFRRSCLGDRDAGMPGAAVLSTVTRHLCLGDDFFPYVFWFSR